MLHPTSSHFNLDEFYNLPRQYSPVYAWAWNGPTTREKTDVQLSQMAAQGVRILYIIPEPKSFRPASFATIMEPDYLTPAYFEEYKYAMEKAISLGMECWLYNEGGWPSGGACGKVLRRYPHLAKRKLSTREIFFDAGTCYEKTSPDVIAAFADTERLIDEGYRFPLNTTVTEYYSEALLFQTVGVPDYPDMLLPESTQHFLKMTHDAYLPYLRELFGKHITAVFTDEPAAPRPIPMRQELLDAFEAEYGESILPALPAMVGSCKPSFHQGELIANWFDLCSRWFCDNYLKVEKKWCNDHGMAFTGHMDKDDEPGCLRSSGNFHSLRALRCLDIPGVDVIWRQIYPGNYTHKEGLPPTSVNGFFPRHASSAAYQMGGRWSVTESFGVYGAGLTYDLMRYLTNFQAIRGVSIMNAMLYSYHREDSLMTGELPNFDGAHPYYRYLLDYNRYAERICYLTTLGERVCDTALYYPARDISVGANPEFPYLPVAEAKPYDMLGRAMEDAGIDFDVIDDDLLQKADGLDEGELRMGLACYRTVYLPDCRYMPEASKQALVRFEASGGRVCRQVYDDVHPTAVLSSYKGIRLMRRVSDWGDLLLVFNENTDTTEVKLTMDGEHIYLIDPTTGSITHSGRDITMNIFSGDMIAIYATTEELLCDESFAPSEKMILAGSFTLRPLMRFEIGETTMYTQTLDEKAHPVELGDWQKQLGRRFSGAALYETSFVRPKGVGDWLLVDLGDVRHACEVRLNGEKLGARIAPPYRYRIPAWLLREENTLSVEVSNTAANEHHYTDSFEKWPDWMIASYVKYQDRFDEDSLPSGLYGPVTIFW